MPIPPKRRTCAWCRWQGLLSRAMNWCRPWRLPGNSVRRKPSATELIACSGCCLNALNTSPIQRSVAGWYMPCIRLPAKRYFPPICGRRTVVTGLRTLLYGILWVSSVPDRKTVCFSRRASACARPTCSSEVALERIGVMNRVAWMFPDLGNDTATRRAAGYYRRCVCVPADPLNFDEGYLCTLGRMYEVALQGNALPVDKPAAWRIARFMYDYSLTLPVRGDAWYYCTSYVIHCIAESIGARLEAEMERHIA